MQVKIATFLISDSNVNMCIFQNSMKELGLFERPKFEIGDVSQYKVPWLMECRKYAFLYGELEKFHKQANKNFYMCGVMKQLMELLDTAKILNPTVRSDFLKKAEEWFGEATQPKGKRLNK